MYFSSYSEAYLTALASQLCALARKRVPVWCVFDNTAYGVATGNALDLLQMLPKMRLAPPATNLMS